MLMSSTEAYLQSTANPQSTLPDPSLGILFSESLAIVKLV